MAKAKRRSRKTRKRKIVEIPIAENIAEMNLNWATRKSAGSPYFGMYLDKYAPRWAKVLFLIAAIFIILAFIVLVVLAPFVH